MTIGRMTTAAALVLGLSAALGACAGLHSARDRIVRPAQSCVDQHVAIYFEPQSADIGKEGHAVIAAAAQTAKGCKVTSVEVLGLADATGAADANLELSKQRAQAVGAALAAAGLPAAEIKPTAAGQAGATTADGKERPLRRRAEVVLRLGPR